MDAGLLWVIAVVSNPLKWQSRMRLYRQFCQHMLQSGVHLITVECVLRDRKHELADIPGVKHIAVHHETLVWHKESLINIGLQALPRTAEYVAWIDADIHFRSPTWASDTVDLLQLFPIIQLWEHCYDLGPNDEHMAVDTSFASFHRKKKPICPVWSPTYGLGHSGYGWAARREALAGIGGLLDFAALGSADHHMAMAFLGRIHETVKVDMNPAYHHALGAWQKQAQRFVGERIGYLPGTIEHQFHGMKKHRNYLQRWDVLRKHKFDPRTDLTYNLHGVIELTDDKPKLRHDMEIYFSQRCEDSTTLS